MLQVTMEPDVIKGLGPSADQHTHSKAIAYFEQVKSTNQGLEYCATALAQGLHQEDHVNFFLWQVLEHQVKYRYAQLPANVKLGVRSTLITWLQNHRNAASNVLKVYLRNKAAQVFALVFSREFLVGWQNFIEDIMLATIGEDISNNCTAEFGANMYLKILLAIDSEVVDRTIDHTTDEQNHNQLIKDRMRETCVQEMVKSWYFMLACSTATEENVSLCLQVIGAYIAWIDINFIANDQFMPLVFERFSKTQPLIIRECACDCMREIAIKGMVPQDKLELVESLWHALQSSGILSVLDDDAEIEFIIKLSRLISSMTSTLIFAWNKLMKPPNNVTQADKAVAVIDASIHAKMPVCLRFFGHDDDDVSFQCFDLLRDYLDMLKRNLPLTEEKEDMTKKLFYVIVEKLKYDEDYKFDNEGEDEAEFDEYLRNIKVIYDNLSMLSPRLVISSVHTTLSNTLSQWQTAPFNDVEVAIRLLYMLGESIPSNLSTQFSPDKNKTSPLHGMMTLLLSSGVSNHPHSAVRLQFFETVTRYDRYFPAVASVDQQQSPILASTTQAFIDHRGLQSNEPKVRSRCAYLMSRFVKTLGKLLSPFAEEILLGIQDLLVLSPVTTQDRALSNDDQLFIYELAGNLIVNSNFDSDKKTLLMTSLLRPLVEGFQPLLQKMNALVAEEGGTSQASSENVKKPSELCAIALNYMMSYASRSSKAFSNKQTMSQSGCARIYTDALKVFLQALDTEAYRTILHTGVRQYLHRMVICLEEEVLPFVPLTVRHLLSNQESKSLHDFIPLLNQVVNKFKKTIEPFLREVFMLVVRAIFDMLLRQSGDNTQTGNDEAKLIRRTYFQFLLALVTNDVASVILLQDRADVELVLSTLLQGAVEVQDTMAQKLCFSVLTKLVQAWDVDDGIPLMDFVRQSLVPACFVAPLNVTFDLTDAQTVLALNESSYLLKAIHKKKGEELEVFLLQQYLPSLNISQDKAEEYCQALRVYDNRAFRSYVKAFFTLMKT